MRSAEHRFDVVQTTHALNGWLTFSRSINAQYSHKLNTVRVCVVSDNNVSTEYAIGPG